MAGMDPLLSHTTEQAVFSHPATGTRRFLSRLTAAVASSLVRVCSAAMRDDSDHAATAAAPTHLKVGGMNCQGCVANVSHAALKVPGVERAEVSLEAGRVEVHWKPGASPMAAEVAQSIRAAGHPAREETVESDAAEKRLPAWRQGWTFNVLLGGTALIILMAGEWGFGLGMERWFLWLAFALGLTVQVLCGGRFYRGAWQQLRVGRSNMDTLVALGSTAAFAYSAGGLLTGIEGHLYFMEAVGIITLISIGHWLEGRVSARAADALRALMHLAPATARWLSAAGVETEIPVAKLGVSDRVLLKPGDRVPVDGEVAEGASAVNESMLTGESLPVEKAVGAPLYTGTLNQTGRLVMRVTATGEATALAQIIAVVQRAQNSRAGIQRLADRVSSIFVPVVVLIALSTAAWWGLNHAGATAFSEGLSRWLWNVALPVSPLAAAVIHATAVLIVACPCAMGLATPAAIMAAANAAARRGILIRDGEALEKSGRINTVLFDKTGTLTAGRLSVAAWEETAGSAGAASLESLAALLAGPSNHPLSRAIVQAVERRGQSDSLDDWHEVRGSGVEARTATGIARLGSLPWLQSRGVRLDAGTDFAREWQSRGATVLGVALDREWVGAVALQDELKPAARAVVAKLRREGHQVHLVTGDNRLTATAIAQQAGIDPEGVFAEVRPEAKAGIVAQLQQRGLRVAFVGDGINDAPALEQADLGVAVSQASDVAREAADIILLRSDIEAVPQAIGLARAALRTIKQNLFWAFFYNAAAVPLAALGFLSPLLCAAAMGLSDLMVIGNALRLLRWRG